jgi:hypothetical protein
VSAEPVAPRIPAADFLAIDVRTLALFRILLGSLLLADLAYRSIDLRAHYADAGVLPRAAHRLAFGEVGGMWSLHLLSGSVEFQALLFAAAGAAAVALLVGWWTQPAAFVSWLLLVSLHHRQPLVVTGADQLLAALLFWSLFLPLAARWSVDARRDPPDARSDAPVRSAASAALLVQVALVYLFAAGFKLADPSWRGLVALEESFSVEGVATDVARLLLGYPGLLRAATLLTLLFECAVPVLIFVPWRTAPIRTALVGLLWAFHLLGIGLTMDLGLIGYVMATAATVLRPRTPGRAGRGGAPMSPSRCCSPSSSPTRSHRSTGAPLAPASSTASAPWSGRSGSPRTGACGRRRSTTATTSSRPACATAPRSISTPGAPSTGAPRGGARATTTGGSTSCT